MAIQLIVTTGTSLAESSIKIDSDLALTPDQELSNEKQIVIKVSDKSKAQRDLSLTVPAGATFDSTATEKLNQDPTYSVEFDSKDKSKQLTLKESVDEQAVKTTSNETTAKQVLKPSIKKDYLLVFKVENSEELSNQQLKLTTALEGVRYESKSLNFKEITSLNTTPQVKQGDEFSRGSLTRGKVTLKKFPKDWAQPRGLLPTWQDDRLIVVPPSTEELTDDYSFYPRYTEGKTKVYLGTKLLTGQEADLFPNKVREDGGIRVKNAGYYHGKSIDIKIDIGDTRLTPGDDWNTNRGLFRLGLKPPSGSGYAGSEGFLGFRGVGSSDYGGIMPLTYTFTDHATGQPVSLGGYFTWADIDYEAYRIKNSDVDYVVAKSNSVVDYGFDTNYFHFYASGLGDSEADIADKKEWGQFFFSNKSQLKLDIYAPDTVNGFTAASLIKIDFPTISPIVYGDEEGSNLNDQRLDYRAIFEVPYRDGEIGYPNKYEGILNYETILNDPSNIVIKRQADGANVNHLFDVSVSNGKIKLTAKNPSSENFYANVYEVTYSTTVKEGEEISRYYSDGRYRFPITGLVDTGDGKEHKSNIDYATIIAPKPKLKGVKLVKNLSIPDDVYAEETTGHLDDELSYQMTFTNLDAENEFSAGTVIEDVLDEDLASADDVNIEYVDIDDTIVQKETAKFDKDGNLKLTYAIPKAGHVVLKFKTKIIGTEQETIKNVAKAINDGNVTQSNDAKVTLPPKVIPSVRKEVRNISNNETNYAAETSGAIGDEIEYRVMAVNITKKPIVKGTLFRDSFDSDLIQDGTAKVEYYDISGKVTDNEEVALKNGQFKLSHEIVSYGHIRIYIKAEIDKTDKTVINNTATVADGKSDVAKVNIIQKTPPTVIKEVKNLTKSDEDYALETKAEVNDEVEYRIQLVNATSVDIKSGAILKDVLDSDLGDIQQVKIDYLDKDENITATQTADLTDDQVTLDHVLPAAGRGMAIAYIKAKVKETDKSVINNKASLATELGKGISDNAKLNLKASSGRIVVRYRDRKDESHKLAEDETFDGKIGDTKLVQPKVIPETDGNWTVVDSSNMTDPDWGSTTKPDWTLAHDYTVTYAKDEQVITYRYEESHIGIIADKRWDFGQHDTTATDRNYYLKAKTQDGKKQPYEVGVEDYYTSKGWTLNVKQDDQFHTNANEKIGGSQKFLDNAVLNFHNGQIALKESDDIGSTAPVSKLTSEFELAPKGAAVNLMTHTNKTPDPGYYAAHGFGIWAYQFGDAQQADYSIGLKVPKATKRFPRQYTSQLTWSLVIAE